MGDNLVQMSSEVKKEERAVLMKEVNFTVTIPPEQGLAMKADLNIPWNKLRAMRRYMYKHLHDLNYNFAKTRPIAQNKFV